MKVYRFLVLLIITLTTLNIVAQEGKTYLDGHYINNAGETIKCKIANERYSIHNELNILINGIEKTIYPKDCSRVKIEKSILKPIQTTNDGNPKSHFYFVSTTGQFNLYYRNLPPSSESSKEFNFALHNRIAFVLEKNDNRIEVLRIDRRTFELFVKNFPEDKVLIDRLMDVHYSISRWTDSVKDYNDGQRIWKKSY